MVSVGAEPSVVQVPVGVSPRPKVGVVVATVPSVDGVPFPVQYAKPPIVGIVDVDTFPLPPPPTQFAPALYSTTPAEVIQSEPFPAPVVRPEKVTDEVAVNVPPI